jgi:glycosyltransferase involved in cell wall biosynthesis
MKIVFHHPHPLPVIGYGGIERILFWHMRELVRLGHQVVLLGHPESQVKKYGIELISLLPDEDWQKLIPSDAHIIHLSVNHTVPGNIPTINTVHGNGKRGEILSKNSVFVSKKHAEIHNSSQYIHNAIDLNEYPFVPSLKNWNNFLFLAKASWRVKNLADAVSACRKSKKHLHIIGGRWWGISRFIHSRGIIGGDDKLNTIRKCDALIFPVRWHEPFGIAIIEAMSQGLPVIGSPYGSLPEIITDEVGFIVHNQKELRDILDNPPRKFNPMTIRKYVEENFGINKHTNLYLALYQKVIDGNNLNMVHPSYIFNERAENLLPF